MSKTEEKSDGCTDANPVHQQCSNEVAPASAEAVSADVRFSPVDQALASTNLPCGTECGWCEFCRLSVLDTEVRRLRAKYEPLFSLATHQDECATVDEALTRADVAHRAGWTRANQAEVVLAADVRRLRLIEARQVLVEATNEQLCSKLEHAHAQLRDMTDQLNSMIEQAQRESET